MRATAARTALERLWTFATLARLRLGLSLIARRGRDSMLLSIAGPAHGLNAYADPMRTLAV